MTQLSRREAEFLLYQTADGRTRVEVRFDGDTAWLSFGQMAELFQRDKSVISRHVKNVFEEGELSPVATVAESATVQLEGDREVTREVEYSSPPGHRPRNRPDPVNQSRRVSPRRDSAESTHPSTSPFAPPPRRPRRSL